MKDSKVLKCLWCEKSLTDKKKNVRHDPEKGWLHGIDALKDTWYGAYGFCCPGCWAEFINQKLKIKRIKLG